MAIAWLSFMLPLFGFYSLIYAIKSPYSVILRLFMFLTMLFSVKNFNPKYSMSFELKGSIGLVMLVPLLISLISLEKPIFVIVELLLVFVSVYFLQGNISGQYILSYVVAWTLVNLDYNFDASIFVMDLFFGSAIFIMLYRVEGELEIMSREQTS